MAKGDGLAERNKVRSALLLEMQFSKYSVNENGCWIWQGGVSNDGYGKVKRQGKSLRAHRLFYERFVGRIPDGLLVCHRCDTPLCVNPEHLFVGTQLDNERDKDRKRRRSPSPSISHPHLLKRGEEHHKAKLTEAQVAEIKQSKESSYVLGLRFGVNASTIQRIRKGKIWTHI